MNILYLTNHLNIGGITSYVLTLAKGIKNRGHNVYVASCGGELLTRFIDAGINYIPIPIKTKREISPKIIFSMFKLSAIIKNNDIQLLHSNSRTTQVLGCLLNKFKGIPHVSTCHGFFKRRVLRRIFPCWGGKVIAISESVREHLINDFKVDEKNIVIIHNGIDVDRFRNQRKKDLGLGEGPVIGIVARLSEEKGHTYLIEAMREVVNKIPQAELLIVGDGRTKEELVNLAKTKGLEDNVSFLPSVCDTQNVLSAMDIFVLPSLKEGLGLALMEAMACGLAVIGSDIGGIRSLVRDGFNGLLVRPTDVNGLSQAILELLQNTAERESLGKHAAIFINENFSQEKMAIQTEEVYLKCLNPV